MVSYVMDSYDGLWRLTWVQSRRGLICNGEFSCGGFGELRPVKLRFVVVRSGMVRRLRLGWASCVEFGIVEFCYGG